MSLNTAHCNYGVLIYTGERILIYCDGVQVTLEGGNLPKGSKKGRIYLTTHRVIFLNNSQKDHLLSFSMPFFTLRQVELEQPVFSANYIKGTVFAEQGGKWSGNAAFKLCFNKGGAIEFGQAMLQAGKLASRYQIPQPPPYTPPQGPFYQPAPPAYTAYNYGWVPYQTFPNAPPAHEVFMAEAPPPYPGVDSNLNPYPTGSAQDAKAREAAASSAYYNPANPHNVYMPSPSEPPPPYSEIGKKTN
ncbi:WW domain-binding protein 2 [Octopus sinensis]|uniref:WW domain-binding protein 2 n=1 Tax=Octopus sinensis TaxID=2607531 RepID=A0A6P7SRE2_9MOLL|nr:WW domain-binding protein 2 [Octopus sinensis]